MKIRYEDNKIADRFFTGCDVGDVAESDVAVRFNIYMQPCGRLRVVGYRRVDRKSARIGSARGERSGEVETGL